MKALLAERYLYAFGNRATVQKWKYRLKKTKENSKPNADEHDQDSDSNVDEEDVENNLQVPDWIAKVPRVQSILELRHSARTAVPLPPLNS